MARCSAPLELPLRGIHNVVNAVGVVAMATELGVPFAAIAAALGRFGGVARRFDVRGVDGGATFVDDYAHLPTEIAAVIAAAQGSGDSWKRVVAVFQPNRFNRMSVMSREYADAFVEADVVVLTEIYASGTTPIPGVTGHLVVDAVLEAHPDARVVWLPRREDIISFLAGEVGEGDVCISMGCGDIATLPEEVIARRAARRAGMTTLAPTPSASTPPPRCSAIVPSATCPLAPFTTYRLGGPAALFVRARSIDDLAAVAAARAASGLPVLVVGRGSNLLVADEGFAGIAVLATGARWRSRVPAVAEHSRRSGADRGLALPVVARRLAAAGLARLRVGGRRARLARRRRADERRRPRIGHGQLPRRRPRLRPWPAGRRVADRRRARPSLPGVESRPPSMSSSR